MNAVFRHALRRIGATSAALALLIGVGAVTDIPAASAAPAAGPATVRVAHLSPDMPGVDVYVTSFTGRTSVYVTDATYGDIGAYTQVPAGTYTFSIRAHGAPVSRPPLQTWSLTAKSGYAYTAAEVGTGAHHHGVVFNDDLTPPRTGYGSVRLIQASSRAGSAQVAAADGQVIARDAAFGSSTGYAPVRSGRWTLRATGDGRSAVAHVPVTAGSVTSLLLLDSPSGGIRLASSVDAAGAATMPTGSIDAGGGGTAPAAHPRVTPTVPLTVLLASGLVALAFGSRLARARRARG